MKIGDRVEFLTWDDRRESGIVRKIHADGSLFVSVDYKHTNARVKPSRVISTIEQSDQHGKY